MSVDLAQAENIIRGMIVARVDAMGDAMVKDLKDEVSDPKASRVTVDGWPLRKDTGALQQSIADEVIVTRDGVTCIIGRGSKWYGAWHELVGRTIRSGHRQYPWFWPTWRRNYRRYMAMLGAVGNAGYYLGPAPYHGMGGAASNNRARQSWRKKRFGT